MSFSMGLWVRDTALKLRQEGMMRTKLSLEYMTKSTPVINSANNIDTKKQAGWAMTISDDKKNEDLTWLL
jgi:hypothetical protein